MGLDDREALAVLAAPFEDETRAHALIRRFYDTWFAIDDSVRDLFPPDLGQQRAAFALALRWVLGELVAQRAGEPVAFLAQLGRDHRKYGVTRQHHQSLGRALHIALRDELGETWNARVDDTAVAALNLISGVMAGAAESDDAPATCTGTVLEHLRVSRDIAVVRLRLDQPLGYHPGQYVSVEVPQCPRRWRYLSPAMPADPDGHIEFHIRSVPGGLVSPAVVTETRPGDRWRLSAPHGALNVDRQGGDVLMVAGSTGLAPLRALIMDLARFADNPRVHLFFGARYPCELYDLRTLWELSCSSPWLSVSPVSEFPGDPPWAGAYPDVQPPRGLHVRQTGRLPEVVGSYGGWGDRQILICGRPAMVRATRAMLLSSGAPAGRIQHDPLAA
ncbi:MAG: 2-polyprenylphenol hydroxylase [Mycobacterium sp.]|nr:2-polyprenylphenol hydroxylase [Mycobacterium sp.]